jgi:type VI secretion system ImpA family protein
MPVQDVVDTLLMPLPGAEPTGGSLRYDPALDAIREARREEDPALPLGPWERDLKRADWPLVIDLCSGVLNEASKDLQVAAWLTEAWIHTEGVSGLRNGLRLLLGMCKQYWDVVHPVIVAGDTEYRCGPFIWLDEKVPAALLRVPLTRVSSTNSRNYCFSDWERVFWQENKMRRVNAVHSISTLDGEPTRASILASIGLTSTAYYRMLADDIDVSLQLLGALDFLLDDKLAREAPGFSHIRTALTAMQAVVADFVPPAANDPKLPTMPEHSVDVASPTNATETTLMQTEHTGIRSREDAYRRLAEIADYLARTEPHSPTPHLIRRAINWGNMSVAELLQDLVQSESDLRAVYSLLGLK